VCDGCTAMKILQMIPFEVDVEAKVVEVGL